MSCELQSCLFLRNKWIIKVVFTLSCCFWTKYESIIHNQCGKCPSLCPLTSKLTNTEDSYFSQKQCQRFISQDVKTVWIIVVFISRLDSHSDGTHSLQRVQWWASDVMLFLQICSDEETNSSLSWNFQQFILNNNEIPVENPWFQIWISYIHIVTVKTTRMARIKTITAVFLTGQRTRVWTCSRIPHKTCSEIQPWKETHKNTTLTTFISLFE